MKIFCTLTGFERRLWLFSCALVIVSFALCAGHDYMTLAASLIGVTALIFIAKGMVLGQILTIAFSILYAVISYRLRYFGEMITYLGMTAPIAAASVASWLKNPFKKGKGEVEIASMSRLHTIFMIILAIAVTIIFHFILRYFNTANLIVSTVSITTSFLASYLMLMRNTKYALCYALNDLVLIVLWISATIKDISYFPMIMCFSAFFINDLYGYHSWARRRMQQRISK